VVEGPEDVGGGVEIEPARERGQLVQLLDDTERCTSWSLVWMRFQSAAISASIDAALRMTSSKAPERLLTTRA
jgi:hypothetical protein